MSFRRLFLLGLLSLALNAQPPDITVLVRSHEFIVNLYPAEAYATKIFSHVGLHVAWRSGGYSSPSNSSQQIDVSILSSAPEKLHPHALAYAVPSNRNVCIFFDRLVSAADVDLRTVLLAHVLVHEITHVIEGVNRHSADGLMKAQWTHADIVGMVFRPLPFDPVDLALLHRTSPILRSKMEPSPPADSDSY